MHNSTDTHPIDVVIIGATGDLAQRKILPALFRLYTNHVIPKTIRIIGFSRKDLTDADYREFVSHAITNSGVPISSPEERAFLDTISYVSGDVTDIETYERMSQRIQVPLDRGDMRPHRIIYLAVTPNLYEAAFRNIAESGLAKQDGGSWARILVEKPFGSNPDHARNLDTLLGDLFEESQIFRIDHYLAKETMQNIMAFRFANAMFEPLWNNAHIQSIEIVLYEKETVAQRASFYDGIGALRDVGQNHLLQMLALVLMDDPLSDDAEHIRQARTRALALVTATDKGVGQNFIRGQYDGYHTHDGVAARSKTETFFHIQLQSHDPRWRGVPLVLSSGKGLSENRTEIIITFKDKHSFVCPVGDVCVYNNTLRITASPDQKISLGFWSKKPGLDYALEPRDLSFTFQTSRGEAASDYERIFRDGIRGDPTLFPNTESIRHEWRIIGQVVERLQTTPLQTYTIGETVADIIRNAKQT